MVGAWRAALDSNFEVDAAQTAGDSLCPAYTLLGINSCPMQKH